MANGSGKGRHSGVERFFRISAAGTTVRTEVIAGLATFMTMAYIIFVNPAILSLGSVFPNGGSPGVPFNAAITATALGAALATLVMGLYANYPFALASGMGINAMVAFGLILGAKLSWQQAMGIIFWEGALVTLFVLTNVREAVFNAIPVTLKRAIGVGIGLFIAVIGLVEGHIVTASEATVVQYNHAFGHDPVAVVTALGLLITAWLMARRTRGAILLGIVVTTVIGILVDVVLVDKLGYFGKAHVLSAGALAGAAKVVETPSFATFFKLDFSVILQVGLWAWIFALMMTDFFDTMGTVVAVGGEAGLLDSRQRLPRLNRVLLVDSGAAVAGGLFGASSITTYIESAAGVAEGGRTGLTSVVVALCFLVSIFFAPIIGLVPTAGTSPALIIVGFLMITVVRDIDFKNLEEAIPAFVTMITIPLTYSITSGIGYGFILYSLIKLFRGRGRDVHWLLYVVSVLFAVSIYLGK